MKNYQRLHYNNYYIQKESGEYSLATRSECFAKGEPPDSLNPFPQRWFYDPEASYAVRLPRNELGNIVGKRNSADLKANERCFVKMWRCVWAKIDVCNQNCDLCGHSYVSGLEYLCQRLISEMEHEAEAKLNPELIYEKSAIGEELHNAIASLSVEEQRIISLAFSGLSEREAANRLGIPRNTFVYRRNKAVEKLKKIFISF